MAVAPAQRRQRLLMFEQLGGAISWPFLTGRIIFVLSRCSGFTGGAGERQWRIGWTLRSTLSWTRG
jgi:hypothetical protein